jgi:tRNA(Arg) A34 adenosine deaminase TadA
MLDFMKNALQLANSAFNQGEVPVGAVLVNAQGKVVAEAHNMVEALQDPSAHAEMLAIRKVCETLGTKCLDGYDLYVTLEPCAMCAQVIAFARIRRLYFGAYDPKGGGVEHGPKIFDQPTCHHKPEVYGGIMEEECSDLLKTFFAQRR